MHMYQVPGPNYDNKLDIIDLFIQLPKWKKIFLYVFLKTECSQKYSL